MPLISFDNPWKHGFLMFQGVSKEISGMKWFKYDYEILNILNIYAYESFED